MSRNRHNIPWRREGASPRQPRPSDDRYRLGYLHAVRAVAAEFEDEDVQEWLGAIEQWTGDGPPPRPAWKQEG